MRVAVYGLGKLGLPLCSVLASCYEVVGVDNNDDRVAQVRMSQGYERAQGIRPTDEPGVTLAYDNLSFEEEAQAADVSFIVVPTPSAADGSFDPFYVWAALHEIGEVNNAGHTAVIVSTVSPGTCDTFALQYPELNIVYNPTFIALGSVVHDLMKPDVLIIGGPETGVVMDIWQDLLGTEPGYSYTMGDYKKIELLKLSLNAYLGMKITFANTVGKLFSAYGADPQDLAFLTNDKRVGKGYLSPGGPITGPCLPRDNKALLAAAKRKGVSLPLSIATDIGNEEYVNDIRLQIADLAPKSVGILGFTYKYGHPVLNEALGYDLYNWCGSIPGVERRVYDPFMMNTLLVSSSPLEDVLACEVVVVTHQEYTQLSHKAEGKVINPWR